ncbi:MAG: hypothetical protein VB089_04260, partial [Anaerolineaceae bacterium]|nr:hypothetical protein [Anaerolineaceae bacterium]
MISQDIINSRFGVGLALTLGRSFPKKIGYWISDAVATLIAKQKRMSMVQAVHSNQWVVHQGQLDKKRLDQLVIDTFRASGRCLFDFYHNLTRPERLLSLVRFSPKFETLLERCRSGTNPTLMVIPHTSNFDLGGRAMALRGLDFQVLSYPNPNDSYQWQNQIRSLNNLEVTPMSISAFQKARERLQAGGTVLTGLDRPLPDSNYPVQFFSHKAMLPVAYTRLALKMDVPVAVVACHTNADGTYLLDSSDLISPVHLSDLPRALIENTERFLHEAEGFIRRAPHQWAMYYPVWPEVKDEIPWA